MSKNDIALQTGSLQQWNKKLVLRNSKDVIQALEDSQGIHDELINQVHRSKSYYKGMVFYRAMNNPDIDMKDVYKESNTSKPQALRHIALYERSIGIDALIEDIREGNSQVRFSAKNGTSSCNGDDDNYELCILEQYQEALQERPTMSNAFEEVKAFRTAKNKRGDTLYRVVDEAILYDDALDFYALESIKLKQFRAYLITASQAAEELSIQPWNISLDQVREYSTRIAEEHQELRDELPDVEIAALDVDERIHLSDESRRYSIGAQPGFFEWYAETRLGYKRKMQFVGEFEKQQAAATLGEILPEWQKVRKKILAMVHPDMSTGSDEQFQTITHIDKILKTFQDDANYQSNKDLIEVGRKQILDYDLDEMLKLDKEFNNQT